MSNAGTAEVYFIAAMFILIFIICGVTVYFFFRTLKREKLERRKELENKQSEKMRKENAKK